jgi:NADPH2:quinone reductase
LVKNGNADKAFQLQEVPEPVLQTGSVKIKVEAFGLNFADVMARLGLYQECPPLPTVLGYDVVGYVTEVGSDVTQFSKGDRVVALTRFGGYSQCVVADARACALIPPTYDVTKATALSTQYCTAWYCLEEAIRLHEGDQVLIHAGAGGLGIAMVQLALYKKLNVFATAGSAQKVSFLQNVGVPFAINYSSQDYEKEVQKLTKTSSPLDACFNSIGGKTVRKDLRLLNSGGKEVLLGAARMSSASLFGKIGEALQFGIYHPLQFMMPSKSLVGVNMLKIADHKPEMITRCLRSVVDLAEKKTLDPHVGGLFPIQELSKAHQLLEKRGTIGKVAIHW